MSSEAAGGAPPTEKQFSISIQGSLSKRPYQGDFVCKIPNQKERSQARRFQASLDGPNALNLDVATLNLHYMVSHLRFSLKNSPEWWRNSDFGFELLDYNVIQEVYDKVLEFEDEWYTEIWGEEAYNKLKGVNAESEDGE